MEHASSSRGQIRVSRATGLPRMLVAASPVLLLTSSSRPLPEAEGVSATVSSDARPGSAAPIA